DRVSCGTASRGSGRAQTRTRLGAGNAFLFCRATVGIDRGPARAVLRAPQLRSGDAHVLAAGTLADRRKFGSRASTRACRIARVDSGWNDLPQRGPVGRRAAAGARVGGEESGFA